MQRLLIFLFLLWQSGAVLAQPGNYSGPARVQVKSFWSQIEKLKSGKATGSTLASAERMIRSIKETDPAFDTAPLEAELKPWKEKDTQEKQNAAAAANEKENEQRYYTDLWQKLVGVYATGNTIEATGKEYYDRVVALDIAAYREKRKQLGTVEPKSYIAQIDNMLADYDAYVTRADRLKWNVTAPMVKARSEQNPQRKKAILENAQYECEAVLILSPNNTAFRQKLDEIKKLLGNAESEAAKFYTGDFHAKHVNQLVWSSRPLVPGRESEMQAQIKNEFTGAETIYGTAYLSNDVKTVMDNNDKLRVVIRIDGGTAIWGGDLSYIIIPQAMQQKTVIQFALVPDAQWLKENYAPYLARENWTLAYFLDELARSGDVSHEISCQLVFPTAVIRDIKSSFTLNLNNGSTEIKNLGAKLNSELMNSRQLPKPGMQNASLEQQMLAAANNLGWNDKFEKTIITSSSWTIVKNELTGAILYRYLGAVCTTHGKDGKCYYQEFTFRQDYAGGGSYSGAVKYNSYGGKREIGCDKLK